MLNKKEKREISKKIYTSDQDYFFYSSLYGEPFLYKNHLYYFDGECLTISGYPLDEKISIENQIKELNELLIMCMEEFKDNLKIINYTGIIKYPFLTDLKNQFKEIYYLRPDKTNVDVFIDLLDPQILKTSRSIEANRRSLKNDIHIIRTQHKTLNIKHIVLIRELVLRNDICIGTTIFLLNMVAILRSQNVLFFEAYFKDELVGFEIVHHNYPKTPFLIVSCTSNSIKGVSDTLYISMIKYYLGKGVNKIGIGYSIDEGLLSYKTKWGGTHCNPPYFQLIWKRRDFNVASIDILNWMGRLINHKAIGY